MWANFGKSWNTVRGVRSNRRPLQFEPLESRSLLASLPVGFIEEPIATGLSNPTAMEIAPNGDVWVLEQAGAVKRFRAGSTTDDIVGRINNLGLSSSGERGLLGIAFDPQYATTKQVFLYYTSNSGGIHNRISAFTVNDTTATDYFFAGIGVGGTDLGSTGTPTETIILDLDPLSATNHNGGAIHFGPDGKLYAAVGENAVPSNAQSLANLHGKILRMNPDGSAPADNPFVSQTTGKQELIWALGLRNPFTFAFQPGTGRMFINDVGQNTWEEVNEGIAGANYGWPSIEGNSGTPPSGPGAYQAPLYAYSHGFGPFQGFAITGGAFYNPPSQLFPSEYTGDYFFADFVSDFINVRDTTTGAVSEFATGASGPVDLRIAPDGSLLYLARNLGQVIRVSHTTPVNDPPTIAAIPDRQVAENEVVDILFTISDPDNDADDLTVTVTADRPSLLPPGNLVLTGTGNDRTLRITPAAGQSGDSLIHVTVSDGQRTARSIFFLNVSSVPVPWHHPVRAFDVNDNGRVTAADALTIINVLNSSGPGPLEAPTAGSSPPPYLDVAPNNRVTARDALYVINFLNAGFAVIVNNGGAEGEGSAASLLQEWVDPLADPAWAGLTQPKKRRL